MNLLGSNPIINWGRCVYIRFLLSPVFPSYSFLSGKAGFFDVTVLSQITTDLLDDCIPKAYSTTTYFIQSSWNIWHWLWLCSLETLSLPWCLWLVCFPPSHRGLCGQATLVAPQQPNPIEAPTVVCIWRNPRSASIAKTSSQSFGFLSPRCARLPTQTPSGPSQLGGSSSSLQNLHPLSAPYHPYYNLEVSATILFIILPPIYLHIANGYIFHIYHHVTPAKSPHAHRLSPASNT